MIRKFENDDLGAVVRLWLKTNKESHPFIDDSYWESHLEDVKVAFMIAELYVYVDDDILGFIGMEDHYLAGIFIDSKAQSQGIGKALLDHVKALKSNIILKVYKDNTRAYNFYIKQGFKELETGIDEEVDAIEITMQWICEK